MAKTKAEQDAAAAALQGATGGTGTPAAGAQAQPGESGDNSGEQQPKAEGQTPVVDIAKVVADALAQQQAQFDQQKAELAAQFEEKLAQQKQEFSSEAKEFVNELKQQGIDPASEKLKSAAAPALTDEELLLKHYGEGYVIARHKNGTLNTFSALAWKNMQESNTDHGYTAIPEAPPEVKNLK